MAAYSLEGPITKEELKLILTSPAHKYIKHQCWGLLASALVASVLELSYVAAAAIWGQSLAFCCYLHRSTRASLTAASDIYQATACCCRSGSCWLRSPASLPSLSPSTPDSPDSPSMTSAHSRTLHNSCSTSAASRSALPDSAPEPSPPLRREAHPGPWEQFGNIAACTLLFFMYSKLAWVSDMGTFSLGW